MFSVKLRSFRAFRDEAVLEIRPLTLMYGFNQAGKSTLLRLLSVLADSLRPGAGPLDLQSPALRGATFKEIGWLGRQPTFTPWLSLIASQERTRPELSIQFDDDGGLVVNRLHLIPKGGDKFKVDLDGPVTRDGSSITADYAGRYRGADWTGTLSFDSLIPRGLPDEADTLAEQVRASLAPLNRLQWLNANRLSGDASMSRRTRCCRADGADLAPLMRPPPGSSILDSASSWLSEQEGMGNEVTVSIAASSQPELMHGATGRERLPLHLAGDGIRSLLPILLCSFWAETGATAAPTMLAIEELEAHLHPTLQVALFDRLVKTVRADIPIVLETHSVYLLRAMQVAILEKRLQPEQVGLYWIGQAKDGASTLSNIGISPDATLSGWRPDLFEKEQELAHRILDLRWKSEPPT